MNTNNSLFFSINKQTLNLFTLNDQAFLRKFTNIHDIEYFMRFRVTPEYELILKLKYDFREGLSSVDGCRLFPWTNYGDAYFLLQLIKDMSGGVE